GMATTATISVELTGRFYAEDAREHRFELRLEDGQKVPVNLSDSDRANVRAFTSNRPYIGMTLKGTADVDASGAVVRVTEVVRRKFVFEYDPNAKPIADVIAEIVGRTPKEEFEKLPDDGARN